MSHTHGISVLGAKLAPGEIVPGEPWKTFLWRTYKAPIIVSGVVGVLMAASEAHRRLRKQR